MNEQKHTVMREILEITVPDRTNALHIQNKVSEIIKFRLNPALDKLFSKMSSPEEIVRIDKLVVDLGKISLKNFEEDVLTGIIDKTKAHLSGIIHKQKEKGIVKHSGELVKEKNISLLSPEQNNLQVFIYFLKTGQIPWWNKKNNQHYFKELLTEVYKIEQSKLKTAVLPLLKQSAIRKRIVFQFNETQILEMYRKLAGKDFPEYEILLQSVSDIFNIKGVNRLFLRKVFFELVLIQIAEGNGIGIENEKIDFIQELLRIYLKNKKDKTRENFFIRVLINLKNRVEKRIRSENKPFVFAILSVTFETPLLVQKVLKHPELVDFYAMPVIRNKINELKKQSVIALNSEFKEIQKKGIKTEPKESAKKIFEKQDTEKLNVDLIKTDGDEIYISNAGLVILHPFLRHFFKGLKLLTNDLQFTNEESKFKAVHLLQYLVSGTTENPEYDLSLNKILCGLDVTEPIPLKTKISKSEREECKALLEAVLEQWNALKTKKTDALTEVYLKREGILSFQNQGWNLRVERNTFDVMLDRLPWPISIIKLPWNPYFIYVEW